MENKNKRDILKFAQPFKKHSVDTKMCVVILK